MTQSANLTRVRLSAAALVIASILFVLYPAIRPFSDEKSLQGAVAFASTEWVVAHLLAVVAFTLLPLGLLGLWNSIHHTSAERQGYWAVVLSWIGVGLTLPFYGEEAYGLHVIGQEAIRQQSAVLLTLVGVMRSGPGGILFLVGFLVLGIAAVLAAIAIWRSGSYSKWSGILLAVGVGLYIPQFFWTQPFRVAHGVLVAIGCVWIAVGLWRQNRQE
jgi:hypothetical protein